MGDFNTRGMDDSQIDTVMMWQARADKFERELSQALLLLARERDARNAADDDAETWKTAAVLRDGIAQEAALTYREQIERLQKEKAIIVNALRPLVELLGAQPSSSLEYFIGTPLKKAVREAAELLSIIDGQQEGK